MVTTNQSMSKAPSGAIKIIFSHLPQATRDALEVLSEQSWLTEQGWYLAGGTALTLQLDHRVSVDLDFFTPHSDFNPEQIILGLSSFQYKFINIADAQDIAVMKIIATSQRGRKRDFFDLYWYIVHREPLIDILKRIGVQYPSLQLNFHHILKSLTYFEEAEEDPDPQVFFDITWAQIKKYFLSIVPETADKIL